PAGAAAGPRGDQKDGGEIAEKAIEIQVNRFVGGGLHQDIHVTNHGLAETTVTIGFELDADFADQREAAQGKRQQDAPVARSWAVDDAGAVLTFAYRHPELPHAAVLQFSGAGGFSEDRGTVQCRLTLRPQESATFCLDLEPSHCTERSTPFYGIDGIAKGDPGPERLRAEWAAGCARLHAANPLVQTAWDRAVADLGSLHLLEGEGVEQFTLAAGIPKYTGLFGRDALMAAWQSALLNPATLRGALRLLGKHQARERDDKFDAEPGKILHQRELAPLAMLGKTPFLHYYGDYSAPALFLLGLATDFAATGDRDFLLGARDKAVAVLEWMERDGDRDRDGFYEYQTRAGDQGVKNQGWKDSDQAILYEDGSMVPDPIATCEIQGMYYAAKLALGRAFIAAGEGDFGAELARQAAALKRRFNERFWMPDQRFIALALDPDKRQVRSIASNAGECLAWGIVDADKAEAVVARLMAPEMFSGWGIRTLSCRHPAYNPLAYHLGTVWPFANALAAVGLRRYGCIDALHRLAKALFEATELFHLNRLPEVFGGHSRDRRHPHPGVYPGASAPQAWSASAVVLLIQTMLGIVPLAPIGAVAVDPCLPEWLPEATLEGLSVGSRRLAIGFRRDASGRTLHEVRASSGVAVLRPDQPIMSGDDGEQRIAAAIAAATR
ncbi:MAG: amylo-alpha-1,6-glucosidase, partial [Alphaproteobacteria bacterium]|nr:amylo-alpha-1,6-glucosidase [Alphaproteobacteria bacterium]